MNRQEVFDKIYLHLIEQGRKSVNSDGRCQYRSPDGDKCAIGCLIPDELYTPELEGNGVSMPIIEDVLNKIYPDMTDEDLLFLLDLQDLHDIEIIQYNSFIEHVHNEMEIIADAYDLNFSR